MIAGIGRSWVDEILHAAMISPFKRGSDLEPDEAERLASAIVQSARPRRSPITSERSSCRSPTSCRCRSRVHRRNGKPCPRCGDQIEAVFYEDYVMCYCPTCQTDGKLLKDRRLSRLLK